VKIKKLFENWDMTRLKINLIFLESEWEPKVCDSEAAWEMYVELLTRIATQRLPDDAGMESSALESVYSLFGITRGILREHGRDSIGFAKIAIIVLNQVIRPFTARWHKLSEEGAFADKEQCLLFREELNLLQANLNNYMGMLAEIAGIEEISAITTQQ
jgi:hypothetical protein